MKKILIVIVLFVFATSFVTKTFADGAITNGINYLGTQLNGATGQILGGSSGDATPWAAIAFSANGIDPSTVKTSTNAPSLIEYLKNNPPTTSSSATDWEKWILAIVASGQNPYDFGGVNYVSTLQSVYYNNNQLGDTSSENDDWFGMLALIASGVDKANPTLTDSLSFILKHQDSDGGFGYSIDASVGSDGNDTAAAIQALVAAQNYGVNNASLPAAITNAKTYILNTQDKKTGGFLYDTNPWTTAPDADSTTWAIMALNVLGMQNSQQANNAKTWLTASPQQSSTDGGSTACNQWDPNTFACTGVASNSTTTSHALIALAGVGWIIRFFDPSTNTSSGSNAPTSAPTIPTDTFIPTPTSTSSGSTSSSTPALTLAAPIIIVPTIFTTQHVLAAENAGITPTPIIKGVLGTESHTLYVAGAKNTFLPITFVLFGMLLLLAGVGKIGYKYFWGK